MSIFTGSLSQNPQEGEKYVSTEKDFTPRLYEDGWSGGG
jgi:hypothetical protein